MTPELVVQLGKDALELTLMLAMPMLAVALVVGVAISLLQAVTQIQEMTLTFVPKIIAVFLVAILAAPWAVTAILDFTRALLARIPQLVS